VYRIERFLAGYVDACAADGQISHMTSTTSSDPLIIAGKAYSSRLIVGTGKYASYAQNAEAARAVFKTVHEQVGDLKVDEEGLALRGMLVRHLVMPGMLEDTREIMKFIASISTDTYLNIMDQYSPAWKVKTTEKYAAINRQITRAELREAFRCAEQVGLWRFDSRWRAALPVLRYRLAL